MKINNQPAYLDTNNISQVTYNRILTAEAKINSGNMVIITGGTGLERELFACVLAHRLSKQMKGKRPYFSYATSIDSAKLSEAEDWGHIVVLSMIDQIDQRYSKAVLFRITDLMAAGNIPILLTSSLQALTRTMGEGLLTSYSTLIKVVHLPEVPEVTLEAI